MASQSDKYEYDDERIHDLMDDNLISIQGRLFIGAGLMYRESLGFPVFEPSLGLLASMQSQPVVESGLWPEDLDVEAIEDALMLAARNGGNPRQMEANRNAMFEQTAVIRKESRIRIGPKEFTAACLICPSSYVAIVREYAGLDDLLSSLLKLGLNERAARRYLHLTPPRSRRASAG